MHTIHEGEQPGKIKKTRPYAFKKSIGNCTKSSQWAFCSFRYPASLATERKIVYNREKLPENVGRKE